jgi:DNA-binding MarR family transcriptional regulator
MKLEEAIQSTKFDSEVHKATINVLFTAYWLKTHVSKTFKELGITLEQFNVMRILKGKHPEPMCVKDIGSRLVEKSSNVPRIVDRLVLKQYVKRDTSKIDKRETLMQLTEKGLMVLTQASEMVEMANRSYVGINENEARELNELLEKLRKTELVPNHEI